MQTNKQNNTINIGVILVCVCVLGDDTTRHGKKCPGHIVNNIIISDGEIYEIKKKKKNVFT